MQGISFDADCSHENNHVTQTIGTNIRRNRSLLPATFVLEQVLIYHLITMHYINNLLHGTSYTNCRFDPCLNGAC
jgi:hypothetical protein